MTKRDFFRVIIKLFGLYSLILAIFNYIPASFSGMLAAEFSVSFSLMFIGLLIITVLIYTFLILKTDTIIRLLKIDKGFDDDNIMLGNFNETAIIKFTIIIFGGFLIIDNAPDFLYTCFVALKKEVAPEGLNFMENITFSQPIDYFKWIISGVNIILGYLFLTNYDWIARRLNRK